MEPQVRSAPRKCAPTAKKNFKILLQKEENNAILFLLNAEMKSAIRKRRSFRELRHG